ncbi:MAG: hypothetical protein ABI268_01275, partial [Rhodanobacter sp.]
MDRSYPDRNELVPAGHFGDGKDTSGTARNQSALTHGDHAVHHDEQRILISGNFKINPRMPSVVFPAHALRKYHILSIEPVHLQDDEYPVLQECASADCHV